MQPVFRSSTTSLISPISSPWALFTFEPMILLVCTYVVDVVVVLLVWAFETSGAMAKPTMASKAPRQKEVFILIYRRIAAAAYSGRLRRGLRLCVKGRNA